MYIAGKSISTSANMNRCSMKHVRWKNASTFTFSERPGKHDLGQQLDRRLRPALGPAELLGLEGVHFRRQFRRRGQVRQEHEPPALELRSVRKVQVLGQRVVLPTARVVDGRADATCRPCR